MQIVAHRLARILLVIWLALTLAFVVLRLAPGDAVDAALARSGASDADVAARRAELGLDDALLVQYYRYWVDLLRGDWGESYISAQPVFDIIWQNLGPTVALSGASLLVGVALGVTLGIAAGTAPWRLAQSLAEGVASLALATPVYWTATLAIYGLTVYLDVLPGVGGSGPAYLLLPALVLGFHTAGGIAQMTASSVRAAAAGDFVRTARAKGLPALDVLDHVLRVGLLPVVAVIALQLGYLLGGTVITETIFVRRGLGRALLVAIENRDYPVVQGIVALSALTFSSVNVVADLAYRWLDPRTGWDA